MKTSDRLMKEIRKMVARGETRKVISITVKAYGDARIDEAKETDRRIKACPVPDVACKDCSLSNPKVPDTCNRLYNYRKG